MNEKIKELAAQAKLHSPLILQHWGKIEALTDSEQEELENIEKFAQLIVQKCITQIEQDRFRCADLLETEYDDGYVDGMGRAERILKEHFGVE